MPRACAPLGRYRIGPLKASEPPRWPLSPSHGKPQTQPGWCLQSTHKVLLTKHLMVSRGRPVRSGAIASKPSRREKHEQEGEQNVALFPHATGWHAGQIETSIFQTRSGPTTQQMSHSEKFDNSLAQKELR